MEDEFITKDDFQLLMDIIGRLTIRSGSNACKGCIDCLKELLNDVAKLIPCENSLVHCEISHQGDRESFVANIENMNTDTDLTFGFRKVRFGRAKLVEGLHRLDTYETAFHWRFDGGYWESADLSQERNRFLARRSSAQGIAASVNYQCESSAVHSTTILCLHNERSALLKKHLNFLDCLVHYLHRFIALDNAGFFKKQIKKALTNREREVLQWVMEGKTSWEVGVILSMSERTVKYHLNNIYGKLDVSNRTQAVVKANTLGLF